MRREEIDICKNGALEIKIYKTERMGECGMHSKRQGDKGEKAALLPLLSWGLHFAVVGHSQHVPSLPV